MAARRENIDGEGGRQGRGGGFTYRRADTTKPNEALSVQRSKIKALNVFHHRAIALPSPLHRKMHTVQYSTYIPGLLLYAVAISETPTSSYRHLAMATPGSPGRTSPCAGPRHSPSTSHTHPPYPRPPPPPHCPACEESPATC